MGKNQSERYVLIIGGVNIDIAVTIEGELHLEEMNPGSTNIALGGVGRNIALNLRRLKIPVKLISALTNDVYGKEAMNEATEYGVDMAHTVVSDNYTSSTVIEISDRDGTMKTGVKAANPLELITVDYLKKKASVIDEADYCVVEASLSEDVLEYLGNNHKNTVFFVDPASKKDTKKLLNHIGKFDIVKPNQTEAEVLTGITIENAKDAKKAAEMLIEKGVRKVFITLDDGGAVYHYGNEAVYIAAPKSDPISTTGAGDAFDAALIYCLYHDMETDYSVNFAIAASTLTLQTELAVHPELSEEKIKDTIKKEE